MDLNYKIKTATIDEIYLHLLKCNSNFIPPLDTKVDLIHYSKKLHEKSVTFEFWDENLLTGLVSCYFNLEDAFITNVSIIPKYNGKGIASKLMSSCIDYSIKKKIQEIKLEVSILNIKAIHLYYKFGFIDFKHQDNSLIMKLIL